MATLNTIKPLCEVRSLIGRNLTSAEQEQVREQVRLGRVNPRDIAAVLKLYNVKKHCGYMIQRDLDGFFWRNGADGDGYFDTLEQCEASIEDYCAEQAERYGTHPDSPSLQDSYGDAWQK